MPPILPIPGPARHRKPALTIRSNPELPLLAPGDVLAGLAGLTSFVLALALRAPHVDPAAPRH
jgi:hypothetical protein